MKYKIEKNTVQETLIIPLYSRKLCSELYPNLYRDEMAVHLIDQIDYDFSQVEKKSHSLMQRFGSLEVAMRQNDLAWRYKITWQIILMRRWSIWAVDLTVPAEPVTMAAVKFTIWIFRMLSPYAINYCPPETVRKIFPAI